jgi:hypothetical protein
MDGKKPVLTLSIRKKGGRKEPPESRREVERE